MAEVAACDSAETEVETETDTVFDRLLIANRGEIACRIIRTARRLGLKTVAVYSEADETALHVVSADEAYCIGPPAATESYLRIEAIVAAAERSGAQAIHPGYGFLAESAEFAEACARADIVFVGPPPEAIRVMGRKHAALELMHGSGVPVLPGYRGSSQSDATLRKQAAQVGYPLLIKPSAGGGGKGMRIVRTPDALPESVTSARREAASAFGDDTLMLEKLLNRPRHVELQVFADAHGNAIHLFERDCSIQRRHQKIVEEAPAPGLDAGLRDSMGEAAVTAARAVGYQGAGTIEFLLDGADERFYFMEMNTRLQVEHPVTEMVLGEDLVEWQLRVAAGEPLPPRASTIAPCGHAIEARLYAEDPTRGFLPASGRLSHLRWPAASNEVRVDTGVRAGDRIGVHYDPMLAKLIVHAPNRAGALRRMRQALGELEVEGLPTNASFLRAVCAHEAYERGDLHTEFVDEHLEELVASPPPPGDLVLAVACSWYLVEQTRQREREARPGADEGSPWLRLHAWRLNAPARQRIELRAGDEQLSITATRLAQGYRLELPDGPMIARVCLEDGGLVRGWLNDRHVKATAVAAGDTLSVIVDGQTHRIQIIETGRRAAAHDESEGHLFAPMPGRVLEVLARAGERVKRGAPLLVLEAMKMEHTIVAPFDGVVTTCGLRDGDLVEEGVELLELSPEA